MIDSPYLPFAMAISATLHSQKNLETHQNRLSRFFQQHPQPGQPAQTAPGGEHHSGLAGFPLTDGALVDILAGWPAGYL